MERTLPTLGAADLARLEINHQAVMDLCLQLEQMVDELESSDVQADIRAIALAIPPLLKQTHQLEEQVLFPDFDRHAGSCFSAMMIERLKAEHRCDRFAAEELSLTLKALADGRCGLALATVAYMIRGFLEALRRHVSSEKLMIETLLVAEAEGREVLA